MKPTLRLLPVSALLTLLLLGGCVAAIGNHQPPPPNVTLGQQLIDLKKARDAGIVTEPEYQAQRDKFLDRK